MQTTTDSKLTSERLAYSVKDAATALGKKPLFIYRKIYDGTLKICADFGQMMIPARELEKLVARTKIYEPRKGRGRPKKQPVKVSPFAKLANKKEVVAV